MRLHPRMLLISTNTDISASLFSSTKTTKLIEPYIVNYGASDQELDEVLSHDFDYLYFRDPFNDPELPQEKARKSTEKLLKNYKTTYSVDGISSYDDMLFEDKWMQYKLFSNFMPPTRFLDSLDKVNFSSELVKKRISCRSRDIIFRKKDFPVGAQPSDYIVQPNLDIEQEYRVYMVGGKVIKPLSIKSSKTVHQVSKIIGLKDEINSDLVAMCNEVYNATSYDFIGLDIVKTKKDFVLLEVNRSCQFKSYFKFSSLNLADNLNSYLLSIDYLSKK